MTAVQLYSIRDAIDADPAAAFSRLAALGFRQVELYGVVELEQVYAAHLAEAKLEPVAGHARMIGTDAAEAAFEAAARLGLTTLIEPAVSYGWDAPDCVARIAEQLNDLAARAAERGLSIGYHNHWWELGRLDDTTALERLAAELDERVVLEIDAFWVAVAGVDAADLLGRLGERVRFVHVKDGPLSRDTAAQRPAGEGDVDIRSVLAAAPQATRIVEFDDYAGDVFEGLSASLAFVEAVDAQ